MVSHGVVTKKCALVLRSQLYNHNSPGEDHLLQKVQAHRRPSIYRALRAWHTVIGQKKASHRVTNEGGCTVLSTMDACSNLHRGKRDMHLLCVLLMESQLRGTTAYDYNPAWVRVPLLRLTHTVRRRSISPNH